MNDRGDAPTVGAKGISFESRIAVTALATAVAVLVLACCMFIFEQWRVEQADIGRVVDALSRMSAAQVGPAVARGDLNAARADLASLSAAPAVRDVLILSPSGAVLAHQRLGPIIAQPFNPPTVTRTPLVQNGRMVGQLVITLQPPPFIRMLTRYATVCGALFFAAVAIALFLGRVLARRVIQPVNRLSRAMLDVTHSGDYSQRVPQWARDEFGLLTDSFNILLAQLQANDEALHRAMSDLVDARDAAQATNMLKSQFLANMSHEIRTPLNGVLAMAQIMALGELAPDQRGRVEVIRRSGEELLAVLNDILDLSKIEAGMMTLEDRPLDLPDLVAQLRDQHEPIARSKPAVSLTITLGPNAGGIRRGDPARINQIMANLISNALKFTPKGEVTVEVDGVGPDGAAGLRLQVSDTGVGISEAVLPRLFQKFSQADGSNTRRYGGAGLGLAICRELVRMMGGRIDVESVEGRGSIFTVTLPLVRLEPGAPAVALREPERRLKVLAAEDIPTNQLVLTTILEAFGAELLMVENGALAVDAWRQGDFDLILMDIQMPVMDGVAAARAIRAQESQDGRPRIPIIAVSAHAMPHHAQTYLAAGMDAHVPKPIGLDHLQAAMRAVLGQRGEGGLLGDRD